MNIDQSFSHRNELWATILLEELHRLGVNHVCIAPGSRSTPLTLAATQHSDLSCHTHFDERGLAFMALGVCKATLEPVAIITTSGSAVANLLPAVVEAWQTQQPLILLTADRPEALIDCGANQAIEQPGIFSHYTAAALNLDSPGASTPLSELLSQIDKALSQSATGPIHINCPYPEPLYPNKTPQAEWPSFDNELNEISPWLQSEQSYLANSEQVVEQTFSLPALPGVIIAGALSAQEQASALALQRQLGWPLLADIQSGLRGQPNVIDLPELALQQAHSTLKQAKQFILLGGRLISTHLTNYLMDGDWHHSTQISAHPGPFDAGLLIINRVWCSVDQAKLENPPLHPLAADISRPINDTSQQILPMTCDKLKEVNLAAQLASSIPTDSVLMLGNSLPVRLFEQQFCGQVEHIVTNRGASGIDGLVATAAGLAIGYKPKSITLVVGDLSLLHDLNSLALMTELQGQLIVIVVNNDGGNIFDLLPVPDEATRDQYYRLSHGYQFAHAAALFRLAYAIPKTMGDFHRKYQAMLASKQSGIIEFITQPGEAVEDMKRIHHAAARTLR